MSSIQPYRIAPATRIGYVNLRVRNLERSLTFYLDVLGMRLVSGGAHTATLSATGRGPGLLVLTARKDASARPPRSTGLYHFAIRVPSRRALALVIRRLEEMQWPVQGYADHDVSEAVYLADPDGIGIEVYADRPRDEWPLRNGKVVMVTEPLELEAVMRELDTWPGEWESLDPATEIGHIHLRVANLETAGEFYHGLLGFDITQDDMAGALFLSAGGYHHHIGLNTWASENGPRPPGDAVGLISYGVFVPDAGTLNEIKRRLLAAAAPLTEEDGSVRVGDPDGNFIEIFAR
ncbi:MAG TPA: VOC family protein [Candidatus Krumholzibacteria bacterium]